MHHCVWLTLNIAILMVMISVLDILFTFLRLFASLIGLLFFLRFFESLFASSTVLDFFTPKKWI